MGSLPEKYNDPRKVSRIPEPGIFFSWIPEFSALESTILLNESGPESC